MPKATAFCIVAALLLAVSVLLGGCVTGFNAPRQRAMSTVTRLTDLARLSDACADPAYADILAGNWNNGGSIHEHAIGLGASAIRFHPSYETHRWMAVEGRINGRRTYPVVLDTGASVGLLVSDRHVLENDLAVHPLTDGPNPLVRGVGHVERLEIGSLALTDWPCFYQRRPQRSGWRSDFIIAGLPALRRLRYVLLDTRTGQAELSLTQAFHASGGEKWVNYPLRVEEDLAGHAFLLVTVPVAGTDRQLQLDTGSGKGLSVSETLWRAIRPALPEVRLRTGTDYYPFIGKLRCRKGLIEDLAFADGHVTGVSISVFEDGSPLLDRCDGLVGMGAFRNRLLVLDFHRNILWIEGSGTKADGPAQ